MELRLRLRSLKHIVNLQTVPDTHLFWKCRNRAAKQKKRFLSPLARLLQEFGPELDKNHLQPIETILPYAIPPHHQQTNYQIAVTEDRTTAKREAELLDNGITFFTDGSDRNGMVGAAVTQQDRQGLTMGKKACMGARSVLNSYVAELYGMHMALQRICQKRLSERQDRHYTIAADSQNAL